MSKESLNEREFELVNIIGARLGSNQRDLSRHLDLSLGQTNMVIRRLVSKGYIRMRQLNKRKVDYILTPKGFAEKMRKSVTYTMKTIRSISLIKDKIREVVLESYNDGERNFYVLGKSDFALMIEMVFRQEKLSDYTIHYIDKLPSQAIQGTLLICKESVEVDGKRANRVVDLIKELAKDENLINHSNGQVRV